MYSIERCDNSLVYIRRHLEAVNALQARLESIPQEVSFRNLLETATKSLVLLAFTEDRIAVGMATLSVVNAFAPYGVIDNVAVAEAHEGKGVGRLLMEAIIADAKVCNLTYIELTSRPARERANHLYPRVGFKLRQSNIYTLDF